MSDQWTKQADSAAPVPPARASRPYLSWAVAVVAVIAAVVAAVFLLLPRGGGGATFTLRGSLPVFDSAQLFTVDNGGAGKPSGSPCVAGQGYDDIVQGAQVVVTASNGDRLAVGQLDAGTWSPGPIASIGDCVFTFAITGIPTGRGPYAVEVAHRGQVVFNQDNAGDLELTLGN